MRASKLSKRERYIARLCFERGWYARERHLIDWLGGCGDEIRRSHDVPEGVTADAIADVWEYAEHLPRHDAQLAAPELLAALLHEWTQPYLGWSDHELAKRADPAKIKLLHRSRAALAKALGEGSYFKPLNNWQPIEVAPRDGTWVLVRFKVVEGRDFKPIDNVMRWNRTMGWHGVVGGYPDDHLEGWMPLSADRAPAKTEERE